MFIDKLREVELEVLRVLGRKPISPERGKVIQTDEAEGMMRKNRLEVCWSNRECKKKMFISCINISKTQLDVTKSFMSTKLFNYLIDVKHNVKWKLRTRIKRNSLIPRTPERGSRRSTSDVVLSVLVYILGSSDVVLSELRFQNRDEPSIMTPMLTGLDEELAVHEVVMSRLPRVDHDPKRVLTELDETLASSDAYYSELDEIPAKCR
jgi:hypothetical protein